MAVFYCIKKDYRNEEINVLRKSGLSQGIIDSYVPPTQRERIEGRVNMINEYEQLKQDVATLKREMKIIKEKMGLLNTLKEGNEGITSQEETH